ncbi:hypothetical protein [Thorsellia anophelis]|uniref:Ig-like domain (Group 2) n=1 Tax=Thorsellia anophelis DSM 18579 TaxID=1123402 RepID=A0A1I0D2G4_9GAMM|nr:hypothetical protein [Thorsellia anophelis]SET26099.1 hypothetical protein SAMN02583745_01828 [Thorsellia anophelis DSM 18579]
MNSKQDNLYKLPALLISVILIVIYSINSSATSQIGSSNKVKKIAGYQPFMQSIGAYLSLSKQILYDENYLPVLTKGSELFIPSVFCQATFSGFVDPMQFYNLDNRYFMFADQDKDPCLTDNHESQLTWFALDSGQQEWESIQSWEDLSVTALNNEADLIAAGTSALSLYTHGLRIPEYAIGKYIGFTYSPVTATGYPNVGSPIKVWDIRYFFGQEEYDLAGHSTQVNEGKRLEKIDSNASFGKVVENPVQPRIENLIMKGTFLPDFQLTAEYDFISNSESDSEDVSRFWWGEAGTTEVQAYFQNPSYQTSHQSPVLTLEDVAKVYSVSALPIKKELGFDSVKYSTYYVVGDAVSITSDNPNNQFTQSSNIIELQFSNALNIDNTVSATYTFEKGDPIAEDHSEYTWSYIDAAGISHLLVSDKIVESGKVPDSPKLALEQSGFTLMLEMLPKDQFNRSGQPISISGSIETAQFIADPKSVRFTLNDTHSSAVSVTAQYASGSKDITFLGSWSSNDESIALVDNQGNIILNSNLSTEAVGSVTFSYLGRTVTIDVVVDALPPSISNLKLISILENNELAVFENQGATYDFYNGGKLNSFDSSTYVWRIKNESSIIGNGTVRNSGIIPFPTSSSPIFHSGKVVVLEVTPRDNLNRTGQMQPIEAKLEAVRGIEVEPSPLEIRIQGNGQLRAYAIFEGGRKFISPIGNTAFDGVWTVNDPGITISYSGYVTARNNAATGTITYTYRTFSVDIPFRVIE